MTETSLSMTPVDGREIALVLALRDHCLAKLIAGTGKLPPEDFQAEYFYGLIEALRDSRGVADVAAGRLTAQASGAMYVHMTEQLEVVASAFRGEAMLLQDISLNGALRWVDRGLSLEEAVAAWRSLTHEAFVQGTIPAALARRRKALDVSALLAKRLQAFQTAMVAA